MSVTAIQYTAAQIVRLRNRSGLSRAGFAQLLRVSVRTLQNWEQGTRVNTGPALALLRVIDREPRAALRALHGGIPVSAKWVQAN